MKIVFLDAYTLNPGDLDLSPLLQLGELTVYDRTPEYQVISRCKDADIIISNKVKLSSEIIAQLPKLKFIQIAATGTNNVDLAFAKENKIVVANVSGYSTSSVSQHVFATLLAFLNRSESYFKQSQEKKWAQCQDFSYWDIPIRELKDKTFGVWGLGKIGQAVAQIAFAFEMKVIAVNKHPEYTKRSNIENVSTEQLLESSDVISLHTPLNDSTFEMINTETLSKMKTSAILINTGRGQLIDEAALAQALKEKKIAAALLDVLTSEPPPENHILLTTPNCFITPHQAWASQESRQRLLDGIVANIKGFQIGKYLNRVG